MLLPQVLKMGKEEKEGGGGRRRRKGKERGRDRQGGGRGKESVDKGRAKVKFYHMFNSPMEMICFTRLTGTSDNPYSVC